MKTLKEFPQHLWIITSVLIIISYWCYVSYANFKKKEIARLQPLYNEIEAENETKRALKNFTKSQYDTEKKVKLKLIKIKCKVVNIEFSLTEIFKHLSI